jgi:hypothetical protein
VARVTQPNAATYLSASLPIDTRTSENATGSCKFKVIPCKKEKKTKAENDNKNNGDIKKS